MSEFPSPKSHAYEAMALSGSEEVDPSNVTASGVFPAVTSEVATAVGAWLPLTVIVTESAVTAASSSVTETVAE